MAIQPQSAEPRQISQLPDVTDVSTQLAGSYLPVDVPNPAYNPAAPGGAKPFLTKKVPTAQVTGITAGPNQGRSLLKSVRFFDATHPQYEAGTTTLASLPTAGLCVGTICEVGQGPDGENQKYRLVADATGPLSVFADADFTGTLVKARWVLVGSPQEVISATQGVAFNPLTDFYPGPGGPDSPAALVFYIIGELRAWRAIEDLVRSTFPDNRIPAPTGQPDDPCWEEAPLPATQIIIHKLLTVKQARAIVAESGEAVFSPGFTYRLSPRIDRSSGQEVVLPDVLVVAATRCTLKLEEAYEVPAGASGPITAVAYNLAADTTAPRVSGTVDSTDAVPEGATNYYFTTARVLVTALAGFAKAGVGRALAAGDSILAAFGILEKRVDSLEANQSLALSAPVFARTANGFTGYSDITAALAAQKSSYELNQTGMVIEDNLACGDIQIEGNFCTVRVALGKTLTLRDYQRYNNLELVKGEGAIVTEEPFTGRFSGSCFLEGFHFVSGSSMSLFGSSSLVNSTGVATVYLYDDSSVSNLPASIAIEDRRPTASTGGDSPYTLPAATADTLGGIKLGSTLQAADDIVDVNLPTVDVTQVSGEKRNAVINQILASLTASGPGWVLDSATTQPGDPIPSAGYVERGFVDVRTANTYGFKCVRTLDAGNAELIIWYRYRIQ